MSNKNEQTRLFTSTNASLTKNRHPSILSLSYAIFLSKVCSTNNSIHIYLLSRSLESELTGAD